MRKTPPDPEGKGRRVGVREASGSWRRKESLLEPPEGAQHSGTHFRLLTVVTRGEQICVVLSHCVCGDLQQQQWETGAVGMLKHCPARSHVIHKNPEHLVQTRGGGSLRGRRCLAGLPALAEHCRVLSLVQRGVFLTSPRAS